MRHAKRAGVGRAVVGGVRDAAGEGRKAVGLPQQMGAARALSGEGSEAEPPSPQAGASGAAASGAENAPLLEVRGLACGYDKVEIVHGIDFEVSRGEFVCVLGPNGCGKTTTMKAVLGLLPPMGGDVLVGGDSVAGMSERERARHLAYIPQAHTPPFPFSVADVVVLGRTPYVNRMAALPEEDKRIARECMERMGVMQFAERPYTHLSGGQQQLVLIARALAQQPDLLVMDEPTASLDFGNQQLVLRQMRNLADAGTSVLMVTHDPDHALFCAHRVIVMEQGRIIADGAPQTVLDQNCLQRIYDTDVRVMDVDVDGKPTRVCVPVL